MNSYARIAIAAAAVVVVAVVGYSLLPGTGGVGGKPTAVPTVASTPTATSTALGPPPNGPITPGTYAWSWPGGQLALDVPSGWTSFEGGLGIAKGRDAAPAVELANWFPANGFEVTHVYADACRSEGQLKAVGPAVADLVAALDNQLSTDATLSNASLAGAAPKRIDLVPVAGLDRATCRHGADGPVQIWANPAETNFFALAPGYSGFAYVVDVRGARLVVTGDFSANATQADIAEVDAIVASFRIQP